MSNPSPSAAAVGRDLGGTARGAGVGRVMVAVPHGQHLTLGEWLQAVRAAGAWEGCQVGCRGRLWVHLTLCVAQGKRRGGAFGCWRTVPFAHLFAAGFFAWRRTLSALAPEEVINPLSSTLERCCGFSQALRKPRCGRWLDTPARCGACRALGLLEEGELGLQTPFLPASILLPLDKLPVHATAGLFQLLLRLPKPMAALGPEHSPGAGARVFVEGDRLFARRVNSTFPLPVPPVGWSLPLPTRQTAQAAPFFGVCRRLPVCREGCAARGARQPPHGSGASCSSHPRSGLSGLVWPLPTR